VTEAAVQAHVASAEEMKLADERVHVVDLAACMMITRGLSAAWAGPDAMERSAAEHERGRGQQADDRACPQRTAS